MIFFLDILQMQNNVVWNDSFTKYTNKKFVVFYCIFNFFNISDENSTLQFLVVLVSSIFKCNPGETSDKHAT